jgi:hypothetical protein
MKIMKALINNSIPDLCSGHIRLIITPPKNGDHRPTMERNSNDNNLIINEDLRRLTPTKPGRDFFAARCPHFKV